MELDKLYSNDAERSVLGAILVDPNAILTLDLNASNFYLTRHQWIFQAMLTIAADHHLPDYSAVVTLLKNTGKLDDVGGAAYLTDLAGNPDFNSFNVQSYADEVRDNAARRNILESANKLAKIAYDKSRPFTDDMSAVVSKLITTAVTKHSTTSVATVLSELYDEVSARTENPTEIFGIPTGLADFDMITGGLQRQEVFMLAGEPGIGKSFLAMQLAIGMAKGSNGIKGTPGVIFQLEMSAKATMRRSVSVEARVETKKLKTGRVSPDETTAFTQAIGTMSKLPIHLSDDPNWTSIDMRAECARLKSTAGIGWVLIDYIDLLKDNQDIDETQRSAIISDRVHAMAKELDLAVIAISDMTKAGMTGQVKGQASLGGSRRKLFNADMIAYLLKTDDENTVHLDWGKFREDSSTRRIVLKRKAGFPVFVPQSYSK